MKKIKPILILSSDKVEHPTATFLVCLVLSTLVASSGCTPNKMRIDEAMRASVAMRGKAFVPPPRKLDDIINVISKGSNKESLVYNDLIKQMNAGLPKNASKRSQIEFYIKRAKAASELGNFELGRENILKAYDLSMPEKWDQRIIKIWANCEINLQNYKKAIILYNMLKERRIGKFLPYAQLAYIYAMTGNFEKAEKERNEAIEFFRHRAKKLTHIDELFKARLDYIVLNMQGKYKEAEPIMRTALAAALAERPHREALVQVERIRLIRNLIDQNRLVEAELEARTTIEESIRFLGAESVHLMAANTILAEVLTAQGRFSDAEKILLAALKSYELSGLPESFGWWSRSIESLCRVLVAKGDYHGALKQYEFFSATKESNPYIYCAFYSNDKNAMLALVMTGSYQEAMELIENAYQKAEELLGKNRPHSAELLAFRAMVNSSIGNLDSAYLDFSEAVPLIAKSKTRVASRLTNHRYQLILESYLKLLSILKDPLAEKSHSFSAPIKALEVSMHLSDSLVQAAVLASTTRMSLHEPRLRELSRAEQDIQQQIAACQNIIQNLLVKSTYEIDSNDIKNLKNTMEKLQEASETIIAEIERRFPGYANLLVNHRQPSLNDIQVRLTPDEVVISISSTETDTHIFLVTPSGPPEMFSLHIPKTVLEKLVSDIRKSITPGADRLGLLPVYDFSRAHELYTLLLKPLQGRLENYQHMILAASGPVGQLPFSVLTTRSFRLEDDGQVLFSNYRYAPWLIKEISISTVPSIRSFVALRATPRMGEALEAFAGFGDPIFNKTQMAPAPKQKKRNDGAKSGGETPLSIRGIRVTRDGNLDDRLIQSCSVESLERLPDTADELLALTQALGADPIRDVFLGKRASESQVKKMDLSNRRVVAFASHALVPYDLDGLDQPAIALSSPSITGEKEDGLLTMAEILDLKLNAEWVILSACNTGAAEGAGAETVSGLGRAFFYAGTRAVLVSMWPVETSSAKKLITSLFFHLKDDIGLNKAQAHQKAMSDLIEGPGMKDKDGRIIASYAHPFFWAPFIIAGDHGMGKPN